MSMDEIKVGDRVWIESGWFDVFGYQVWAGTVWAIKGRKYLCEYGVNTDFGSYIARKWIPKRRLTRYSNLKTPTP